MKEEPYPDKNKLPDVSKLSKRDYCHAVCRAMVDGSEGTDQFEEVVQSYHPKKAVESENKGQQALIQLTKKIGAGKGVRIQEGEGGGGG